MTAPARLPLWAGRTTALLGILLVALSLRTAVSAISPITAQIGTDIELSTIGLGAIGALPPVFFALAGLIAPPIAHRLGLERALLLAVGVMAIGHLARASAGSYAALLVGSALALAATGIANVLLPPLVKRYFPDRVGLLTATYAAMMTISSALPALTAAPLADGFGWRVSLGVWALTAIVGAVPWAVLLVRQRRDRMAQDAAPELVDVPETLAGRIAHSRVAWAIAVTFAATSINAYAMFAWLPQLLVDSAGVSHIAAGSLLSLYSFIAIPGSISAPLLVVRLRSPFWIIQGGVVLFLLGYAGLLLAPGTLTWLWVAFAGAGPILFPVCLALINTRTRSQRTSAGLSGFVQGIGYTLGALGPLTVGILHDLTGGWTVPLVVLTGVALVAVPFAFVLRSTRSVEDDLRDRAARRGAAPPT